MAASQPLQLAWPIDPHQFGVAATDQNHQKGRCWWIGVQLGRAQVTFEMVNPDEGFAMQASQGAARHRRHQQGPREPRGDRGGHPVEVGDRQATALDHLLDEQRQRLHMTPRGDFGHHTAPTGMFGDL